jgi:hypothetical protein
MRKIPTTIPCEECITLAICRHRKYANLIKRCIKIKMTLYTCELKRRWDFKYTIVLLDRLFNKTEPYNKGTLTKVEYIEACKRLQQTELVGL